MGLESLIGGAMFTASMPGLPGPPNAPCCRIAALRVLAFAASVAAALTAGRLSADGAQSLRLQTTTACGFIVAYTCHKPTDTVLFELDAKHPNDITRIGVPASRREAFGERFEHEFLGAEVCASGHLEVRNQRRVVLVDAPEALSVRAPAPPPAAPFAPGAVPVCTLGVTLPKLVRERKPFYPAEAMSAKIQGSVVLEAVVLSDGNVGEVRVMRSLDRDTGLDEEAVRAAREWRFEPGTLHGNPVPVIVTLDFSFRLK